MRILCVFLLLGLLSACATTGNLEELRQVTPRGTPYAIALTQKYLEFSEEEAGAHDWTDSSYFAEKGLMAGYGQPIIPEEIAAWDIADIYKPELVAAREKLTALIDETTQQNMPMQAAEAVYAYDRWIEELDEGWNQDSIAARQTAFYEALNALEFAALEAKDKASIENTAYLVYFGHNATAFDAASTQVVNQVLQDVSQNLPEEILIHGHTDSTGSEDYNFRLSEKRALRVLESLIKGGIPASILSYFAFGESDPAVDKGDSVAEPKNRRVEIFIG